MKDRRETLTALGTRLTVRSSFDTEIARPRIRAATLVATASLLIACQSTNPTPSQVVWGDRVPTAPPAAVVSQPVVARGSDTITLLPISPTGAQIDVAYGYDLPHCGINSPIDVDGSFWDAVGVPATSVHFDGQPGTFRLDAPTQATFTAGNGKVLQLTRHTGAKEFRLCM